MGEGELHLFEIYLEKFGMYSPTNITLTLHNLNKLKRIQTERKIKQSKNKHTKTSFQE